MVKGWGDLDYTQMAYDGGSMITNGALTIPKVIEEYNAEACKATCTCPDADGNIPVVDNCQGVTNNYELGRIIGAEFAKFFNQFVAPTV